jgi:hypothetical protein
MLSLRHRTIGAAERRAPVNAYAYYIVNHHIDYLLEQSAKQQRVAELFPEPTLRDRVASAVAGLRSIFANPIDLSGPVVPTLENYPYRG